jgi:transposase-like protein
MKDSKSVSLRHSRQEIAAKLALTSELLAVGESKVSICRKLGISVMTLHRWQKKQASLFPDPTRQALLIAELKLENDRLRQIASSLALEIAEGRERLPFPVSATGNATLGKSPGFEAV